MDNPLSFADYQTAAARTARPEWPDRLAIDALGLAAEAGEVASELQHAHEQERPVSTAYIAEELGDCLWRIADMCSALGISLTDVAAGNVTKLRLRHPNGFSAATSIARLDEQARGNGHAEVTP